LKEYGTVFINEYLASEGAEKVSLDQYQELGGVQDDEVSNLASKVIPGYPAKATGGNPSVYARPLTAR
jgi:hypothetical protein